MLLYTPHFTRGDQTRAAVAQFENWYRNADMIRWALKTGFDFGHLVCGESKSDIMSLMSCEKYLHISYTQSHIFTNSKPRGEITQLIKYFLKVFV